jgi:hypothetical protein
MQLTKEQLAELSACCDEAETKNRFTDQWAIMEPWMHLEQRDLPVWLANKFGMVCLRMTSSSVTGTYPESVHVKPPVPITPEEITWANQQPMVGRPGMTRLRDALEGAGWRPLELTLNPDGYSVEFRLERGPAVRHMDQDQSQRALITLFRGCGFEVGFSELGVADFEDHFIYGSCLVGPIDEICEHGPVPVEP